MAKLPQGDEEMKDDGLLIPESVAVKRANSVLGTDYETLQEVWDHLAEYPERRVLFQHRTHEADRRPPGKLTAMPNPKKAKAKK